MYHHFTLFGIKMHLDNVKNTANTKSEFFPPKRFLGGNMTIVLKIVGEIGEC